MFPRQTISKTFKFLGPLIPTTFFFTNRKRTTKPNHIFLHKQKKLQTISLFPVFLQKRFSKKNFRLHGGVPRVQSWRALDPRRHQRPLAFEPWPLVSLDRQGERLSEVGCGEQLGEMEVAKKSGAGWSRGVFFVYINRFFGLNRFFWSHFFFPCPCFLAIFPFFVGEGWGLVPCWCGMLEEFLDALN